MISRAILAAALFLALATPGFTQTKGGSKKAEAPDDLQKLSPEALLKLVEGTARGAAFVPTLRGDLTATIFERGTVAAMDCSDVIVRLGQPGKKAFTTTIKSVIDDGTAVRKGDRLVVLDDAELQERAKATKVVVDQAKAAVNQATENLQLVQKEAETDVRLSEIDVRLAELERKKAQSAVEREYAALKVERAKLLLERVRTQGRVKTAQAEAELAARRAALDRELDRLRDVEAQIQACVLTAPQDGLAVYYAADRFPQRQALVAVGEPVREGQKLMQVCDLGRMQLVTRVHEAQVSHVKAGQEARVHIDAHPKRALGGKVHQVATAASQADWFTSDVKVYQVNVALGDAGGLNLRPGMSGEVRIDAGKRSGVLYVPVTAVIRQGRDMVCFVKEGKKLERREVAIGLRGDQGIEVRTGLKEGDLVLRDPQAALRRP